MLLLLYILLCLHQSGIDITKKCQHISPNHHTEEERVFLAEKISLFLSASPLATPASPQFNSSQTQCVCNKSFASSNFNLDEIEIYPLVRQDECRGEQVCVNVLKKIL